MYGRFSPIKGDLNLINVNLINLLPLHLLGHYANLINVYIHQLKHLIGQTLLYNIIL
jgi:hypothetical protein